MLKELARTHSSAQGRFQDLLPQIRTRFIVPWNTIQLFRLFVYCLILLFLVAIKLLLIDLLLSPR